MITDREKNMNDFSPESFEKKDLPFVVNRLSPSIGGEILGIDLSQSLDKKTKDLIYEALLVYKVIFFREGMYHSNKSSCRWIQIKYGS